MQLAEVLTGVKVKEEVSHHPQTPFLATSKPMVAANVLQMSDSSFLSHPRLAHTRKPRQASRLSVSG